MFSGFDFNYLWSLIAFSVGALAGYQGIYEMYGPQSKKALKMIQGITYLLSRGTFPCLIFSVLYSYKLVEHFLWIQAAACGAGWELFLRSKWYVKKVPAATGDTFDDLYKGPMDIVRFYENLFLHSIDPRFSKDKIDFAEKNLPDGIDYPNLSERVLEQLNASEDKKVKTKIQATIGKLSKSYSLELEKMRKKPSKGNKGSLDDDSSKQGLLKLNEKYNHRLIYILLREVGEEHTRTLIREL